MHMHIIYLCFCVVVYNLHRTTISVVNAAVTMLPTWQLANGWFALLCKTYKECYTLGYQPHGGDEYTFVAKVHPVFLAVQTCNGMK